MDAVNIVDVVGEFVNLRKAGVNYKGLCPFHDDTTPSFMVSPAKNICHCFACGEGGNAVNFLMKHEQITYPEALRWLAKKYNIEIEERELSDEEKKEQSERESMFIVNEWARQYFMDVLKNDPDGIAIGKQYFRSRGIRDDIIEKFQLGYALGNRTALSAAAQKAGYQKEFLVKTGLCYENERGLADRYAGRVIFPWLNVSGKTVAFGGRLLDSRTKGVQQKYVNSPDSEIYHKERELYGIFQAKKAIVKEDTVFMVEGYTDVIAMHQAGIENVVANSGTALSAYQVKLLHRFTQNIVLLYDGDEAGIHAAMRGTDMLLQEGMNVKVLLLPDGDDPDSFSRKHSAAELKEYIGEHQTDFIEFKARLMLDGVTDPVKRSEAISNVVKSISVIPDQILRATYLTTFAQRIGMKEQTLIGTMNKFIRQDREDRQKEREREQARAAGQEGASNGTAGSNGPMAGSASNEHEATSAVPRVTVPVQPTVNAPIGLHSPQEQAAEVERMLIQNVIRYGEQIIYENVESDDGQTFSLSVSQYIDFDLGQDGIVFSLPIYNQILAEAVARQGDEGFKAETYFMNHPDVAISQLATQLAIDRHQLGGRFAKELTTTDIRQGVVHLILDLRINIVERRLKELQTALRQATNDMGQAMELMRQYKEAKEIRDALAKQLGRDIVV